MPIDIRDVTHIYAKGTTFECTALTDVNLHIDDGEFVGLIGHTGCGKTTLAQITGALIKPSCGTVFIDGKDIFARGADKRALRRKLGIVFQYPEYQLFEETVAKDVSFGPEKAGYSPEETDKRVRESLALVGLDYAEYAERSPFELSGGQKRKVAIAGVLATRPNIIIMDEPIAGLDPIGRQDLMEMARHLNTSGATIMMISHNMDNLAECATRIIAFREGRVIMDGAPKEIFSRHREVLAAGLGLPEAAHAVMLLNERGANVPTDIITKDELATYLREAL